MVESELKYPDQIDDIVNRTQQLFQAGIEAAKKQGIDIVQPLNAEPIVLDLEDLDED
jgi:hypothetical protein